MPTYGDTRDWRSGGMLGKRVPRGGRCDRSCVRTDRTTRHAVENVPNTGELLDGEQDAYEAAVVECHPAQRDRRRETGEDRVEGGRADICALLAVGDRGDVCRAPQSIALVAGRLTGNEDRADGGDEPVERQDLEPCRQRFERAFVPPAHA